MCDQGKKIKFCSCDPSDPERCGLMAAAFKGKFAALANQGHQISPHLLEKLTDEFLITVYNQK